MIWFAPIIVFLAQALVLIHADICHTIDVATTRTYPPRLRLASVRLHDLICSSENIFHTPPTSETKTWYSAALEPLKLSLPAPEPVAPVIVPPSPTRTVACLVGSDNCMLYSDYSLYADGPSPLSTEPAGFSTDVDNRDPAVPYQAPKGMSGESFEARHSQPIVVGIYIGLAICSIAALAGAFIAVSRIESARARKRPNISYRRSTSPSRTYTGLGDGNNHSPFFVLVQPTAQFLFSDMVYEQAIASTLTELPFTVPLDNDETIPVIVVLGMQCNHNGNSNNVSRQEGETSVNPHFDSSDQQMSDKLTADEDPRSGPLCIDVGAINTVYNRDIVTTPDGVSLDESATMSDVDTQSRVHTAAPATSIINSESVQLPCDEHGLSCGTVDFSLPSHFETSAMPGLVCSASVSSPCKDSVDVLLADLNSEHGFLDVKITSGIEPTSIPLPEPLDDEFVMEALNGQHPPELEASGSVSGLFVALVNSNDVDVTAATSLAIGPGCLSPVVDPSGAIEERIQIIDPLLIPLPEPALDELETDPACIPLQEDDFGPELVFESNAYESSIAIEITDRPASFEDKDIHLLHVASAPLLEPSADELETDCLPEYGSDVQCESETLTTGTIGDVSEIENPSDNKEQENEHLGIPLGLSASIWAPSRDDLSEQSVLVFAETASHDGQGDALTISTSSPIAIPRSCNSYSARTPKKSIGNHRMLNDAVRQSVGERSKQGSSLAPTTLRNIIIRDDTVAHSMVHSVPSEITLSSSHRAPREVDVNSLASRKSQMAQQKLHGRELVKDIAIAYILHLLPRSVPLLAVQPETPIATTNLFAKTLLKASMVLLAYPREVRMRFRNQGFQTTLILRLLPLGVLDFRDELRLREHVIAQAVELIHPLITIAHALCWIGPIRPGPKGPWAGSD